MGVNVSKPSVPQEAKKRHKLVEKMIADDIKKNDSIVKLLLLGPGDSGKSTIMKQMRILHGNGFKDEEIRHQRNLIIGNILYAITTILRAMKEFGINFENILLAQDAILIFAVEKVWPECQRLQNEDWHRLKALWNDAGLQSCFARSHEYQLPSSTKYFCDCMDRISDPNYDPTQQDILCSRASTMGIVEIEFTLKNLTLQVTDVGGQRSQRKKWIHCFENINGLIYVAAMSEYNQVLEEDSRVNRLIESIKLFGMLINSHWFVNSSVLLFLNKKDIFEEKLKICPIKSIFPDQPYSEGDNYDEACKYIQSLFLNEKKDEEKTIYVHRTCATDTRNIEFVLDSSFDILLKTRLTMSGLI